jgi:hypothetical protein
MASTRMKHPINRTQAAHEKSDRQAASSKIRPRRPEPDLQAFLRKAGTRGRALAGLELRIRFADHVNRSFTFHHLAICVATFCGGEG